MNGSQTSNRVRTFGDDEIEATEEGPVDASADAGGQTMEADYSFEGYSVDLLDKVAMMPMASVTSRK